MIFRLTVNKTALITKSLQILFAGLNILFSLFILNNEERGFFYTLVSIAAIQVLFELGFSNVILQYVSKISENIYEKSNAFNFPINNKVADFYKFLVKLYSIASVVLFFIIIITSFFLFKTLDSNYTLQITIIVLAFTTSLSFILLPNLSFLEALGFQLQIWKFRLYQVIINIIFLLLFYYLHFGILAYSLSLLVSNLIIISFFFKINFKLLRSFFTNKEQSDFDYKNEILPYQFKIALSWISGYFIYQIINPLIFNFQGSVIAGKYGLTFAVVGGIQGIALVLISTSIPNWSRLFHKHLITEVIINFRSVLIKAILLYTITVGLFILLIKLDITYTQKIYFKFLPFKSVIFLSISYLFNLISFSLATLIRSEMKEPFIIISIFISVLSLIFVTIGAINNLDVSFIFLLLMTLNLSLVYIVFKIKLQNWKNLI